MTFKTTKQKKTICIEDREEHQVAVLRDLGKDLPFEITNKRIKGWEYIKYSDDGYYLKFKAHETITPNDIYAYIGMLKAFQDNHEMTTMDALNEEKFITIEISLNTLMKKYLHNNNKEFVVDTFRRLATFMVTKHYDDGRESMKRYIYDYSLSENKKNIRITVSAVFMKLLYNNPWLLNYRIMMQIKSNIAKALFLYFTSNQRKYYKQTTLEKAFGMDSSTSQQAAENRRQIKNAMNELLSTTENKKLIASYIYDNQSGNFVVEFENEQQNRSPLRS